MMASVVRPGAGTGPKCATRRLTVPSAGLQYGRPSRSGLLLAVEPIHGCLRLAGGRENGAGVALQDFQPGLDVAGVIEPGLRRKPEIGAQESGTEFGHQLLDGVGF